MKKIIFSIFLFLIFFNNNIYANNSTYLDIKIGKTYSPNKEISITSKGNIKVYNADLGLIVDLNSKNITVSLVNNKVIIKTNNNVAISEFLQDGSMLLGSDDFLKLNNEYRGYLYFKNIDSKLNVINHVELEDYLKGVIPKEILSKSPIEALKSQAICSRSFAIRNINKYIKKGYNLDDTQNSQVYGGKSAETKFTNEAVELTKSMILSYNGEVANAIFGASSGGKTANASEVWGGKNVDYLRVIDDPYSTDYTWKLTISKGDISKNFASSGINLGDIYLIRVKEYDSSGRVSKVDVVGTNGSREITGNKFRTIVGTMKLKSTLFTFVDNGSSFEFQGSGFGHGVGMSQDGAVVMAKQGFSCEDILKFYFPGVEICQN